MSKFPLSTVRTSRPAARAPMPAAMPGAREVDSTAGAASAPSAYPAPPEKHQPFPGSRPDRRELLLTLPPALPPPASEMEANAARSPGRRCPKVAAAQLARSPRLSAERCVTALPLLDEMPPRV